MSSVLANDDIKKIGIEVADVIEHNVNPWFKDVREGLETSTITSRTL